LSDLPLGKLVPADLRRLVLPHLGQRRPEVLVHAAMGEDAAIVDLEGSLLVLSTDPITGTSQEIGWLAVHIACNDLATCGAEPIGVLLALLLPPATSGEDLTQIMVDADRAASSLGVEILGGHTEVTSAVCRPVIVATSLGKVPPGQTLHSGGVQPGDALYLSKAIALEGTAILAREREAELLPVLGEEMLQRATSFLEEISVVAEGLLAASLGAHAMHDVTEGGLLGGAWEMMEKSGHGLRIEEEAIPVRLETSLICQALELDPLSLISSGAMLIAAPEGILEGPFAERGFALTRIGIFIPERRLFFAQGGTDRERIFEGKEELWRGLARRKR
jgi:hydrogenase expression/formation protein HypE